MTRRKLSALIIAGVALVAVLGIVLHRQNQTSPSQPTPATAKAPDAVRPPETAPAQIVEMPQRSQDVYLPPGTPAVGSSPQSPTR